MAEIGHNSGTGVGISRGQLRSIVERIERLEEEKQAIADDIKEVYAEAKSNGFDSKIIRQVVRIRKQDTAERQEQEALLDVYLAALGTASAAERGGLIVASILIDLTEDENHWNGEIDVKVVDQDSLTGMNAALAIGQHEIILTVNQAITLYDMLDAWLFATPRVEAGAIRGRVAKAVEELLNDHKVRLTKGSVEFLSSASFAVAFEQYLRVHGVRYRLAGDDEYTAHMERRARIAAMRASGRSGAGQ